MAIPGGGMGQWSAAIAGWIEIKKGSVVRLDPKLFTEGPLSDEEKERGALFRVDYGNGLKGWRGDRSKRGTGIFGEFLCDGEKCRVERFEVVEIVIEPEVKEAGGE